MSTKTTFKRIALVAVAALGFGMLSVVPSNAAVVVVPTGLASEVLLGTIPATGWVYNTDGSAVVGTQVASPSGYATLTATGNVTGATSLTLTVTGSTIATSGGARVGYKRTDANGAVTYGWVNGSTVSGGTITGGSVLVANDTSFAAARALTAASFGCGTEVATANYELAGANTGFSYTCGAGSLQIAKAVGANAAAGNSRDAFFNIATTTAGAISAVLSATSVDATTGISTSSTLQTFNISVTGSATAYSSTSVALAATAGWLSSEATPVVYASKAVTAATVATVTPTHTYALASAIPATTVSLTGVGYLLIGAQKGSYVAFAAGTAAPGAVGVYADGRAGTATIVVAVGGVTVSTKTVKFYGNATKVEAAANYVNPAASSTIGAPVILLGSAANASADPINNDPAVAVLVTDALGTPIPTGTVIGTSSNTAVVTSAFDPISVTFVDNGAGLGTAGVGYRHIAYTTGAADSGKTATLTYSFVNASDASVIKSDPITVTIGGAVKTATMTSDATSYIPGQKGVITITAKDKDGNVAADGSVVFPLGVSATTSFGGSIPTLATAVTAGVATKTFYAPVVPGNFSITGTLADGTKVTVAITVAKDTAAEDAAAEATDAANAATDAANAAAEAADAATAAAQDAADAVAALSAQVATLISALKAQLTSLTNLVIKIQKKVKA